MDGAARQSAFVTSIALFGGSLLLPSFSSGAGQAGSPGIFVLMMGWLGLVAARNSPSNLAWLANVALVASWGFGQTRMRIPGIIASLFAVGLAALPAVTRQVAVDEAGMPRAIAGFGAGYFAWCGAMAVALAAACLIRPYRADR